MTNAPTPAGMAELRDAITLILPLAKGYAAAHPVGSNQSYVDYVEALIAAQPSAGAEPVEVTLFCPKCALPHVDEGEWATTRHHKTHQCQGCGHEWRPFPFATVGVSHPPPPAPEAERLRPGKIHTIIMDAVCSDLMRQNPGAFTEEDGNSTIAIPTAGKPFLTIDVSTCAEQALAALQQEGRS